METNRSSPTPLLSLRSIYIISSASFVFHQLYGNLPKSLRISRMFISDLTPYSLRSSNDIYIPPIPTIQSDFNSLIACQQVWNSLPSSVERCHSFENFKKILKDHFIKNQTEQYFFFSFYPEELMSPQCLFVVYGCLHCALIPRPQVCSLFFVAYIVFLYPICIHGYRAFRGAIRIMYFQSVSTGE